MMLNKFKIWTIVLLILSIVLLGSLGYIWKVKNDQINSLNSQILNLNSDIQTKNKQIESLDESLKLVKFVCIFYSYECREQYTEKLRLKFLDSNGIKDAKYQGGATGQNYYKYFLDPQPDFPLKMREFIKAKCPTQIYNVPGKLFSRYIYEHNNKEISIIMDDDTVEILCAWTYDQSTDSYIKI